MALAELVCGLDLGGTKILGLVVDPNGSEPVVVAKAPRPTHVIEGLATFASELIAQVEAAHPGSSVRSVGVGAPGLVDRNGVFRFGPHLPEVVRVDLANEIAERVARPVVADNDATCAAWAEHERGAARGCNHSITITLGTGIGAGFTVKGNVLRGAHGFAGEPGHMVVDPSGPVCNCGRAGCWEMFASGRALGRMGRRQAHDSPRMVELAGGLTTRIQGEHVVAAAIEGDTSALEVIEEFAGWVALGIANIVNILDSEIVVIGGGLAEVGDVLLEPVRRAFAGLIMGAAQRDTVPIVAAQLGERAGAWGAALLAAERA